jgi:N-acetylglutamate synthase-like GNAT family acetyltransferase
MLRLCSEKEFDQYKDFAYELAMDLTKSGYPTYCDRIKTKAMFIDRSLKAFERETEQLLLYELEGQVQGMIHLYWMPEDHYLSTSLFLINKNTERAISEFCAYAREKFNGYDLYLGFPADNHGAVSYLTNHGFECIENDYNNTSFLDGFEDVPENKNIV